MLIWLSRSSLLAQDTSYYRNSGKIKSIGRIVNDRREGTWNFYYLRGTLSAQLVYNEGRLDGEQFYYYPNGSLQALEIWNQGFLQDSAFYYYLTGELEKKESILIVCILEIGNFIIPMGT